jgi:hypothetical protein
MTVSMAVVPARRIPDIGSLANKTKDLPELDRCPTTFCSCSWISRPESSPSAR